MELLDTIRTAWGFTGLVPRTILEVNAFGNILIEDERGSIWRISPELLSCEPIASSPEEVNSLLASPDFKHEWEMHHLVDMATAKLGTPTDGRCFCLKIPAVLGGRYDSENIGTISISELVSFAGDLALQINDLPDGARVRLVVK